MRSVVLLVHVALQVDEPVGVTPLVVVPGDKFNEVLVELNTLFNIEDGGPLVIDEVGADNLILADAEDALHGTLLGLLALLDNIVHGLGLLESAGEVDDGDIGGGHTELHTGQLTVKLGDNLTDLLLLTSLTGDDVLGLAPATPPVLTATAGTINSQLGLGHLVNGGHKTLLEAKVIIDDLLQGLQTVGGATLVGDNVLALVLVLVDAHDEHGLVLRGLGDNNLLLPALAVLELLLLGGEDAGGLTDVFLTLLTPANLLGGLLVEDVDLGSVHNQELVVTLLALLDGALEGSVDGIVFKLVDHVFQSHEGIVDLFHLDVLVFGLGPENESSDPAEAVNAHRNNHF